MRERDARPWMDVRPLLHIRVLRGTRTSLSIVAGRQGEGETAKRSRGWPGPCRKRCTSREGRASRDGCRSRRAQYASLSHPALRPLPPGEGWGEGIKTSQLPDFVPPHPVLLPEGEGTPCLYSKGESWHRRNTAYACCALHDSISQVRHEAKGECRKSGMQSRTKIELRGSVVVLTVLHHKKQSMQSAGRPSRFQ